MEGSTLSKPHSTTAEYEAMPPEAFAERIADKWNTGEQLVRVITEAVSDQRITPVEGVKMIACSVGELFGYDEFHGGILTAKPNDLVAALAPYLGGNRTPR